MIEVGETINGKYRLVRLLGDGGMGSVYEAVHEGLGTRVAIKVLHPELARRPGLAERFLQEARVSAQIRSPHVVQVMDVDRVHSLAGGRPVTDARAFIVMELLQGEPLSTRIDRERRLPAHVARAFAVQILEALEAAHALGIVHRDLKPDNVFVTLEGDRPLLKLIDFGIAKLRHNQPGAKNLTVAGIMMGTAEYMAPEQARSAGEVDARADLYAVGVMLYEMLAGVRPASGEDARVVALRVERGEVTPLVQLVPDIPRELAGLVHRAMAPRPELRFASAFEMKRALLAQEGGRVSQLAPAPSTPEEPAPTTARAPPLLSAVGTAPPPPPVRRTGTSIPEYPGPVVGPNYGPPAGYGSPGAYGPPPVGYAEPWRQRAEPPPKGRGSWGVLFLVVLLPLFLGAGIVFYFVDMSSGDDAVTPARAGSPTPTPSLRVDAAASSRVDPLPALSGANATPSPTVKPQPSPGPGPSPAVPVDSGTAPLIIPSAFPFPLTDAGALPIPPLPSTLPSVFPWPFPPPAPLQ